MTETTERRPKMTPPEGDELVAMSAGVTLAVLFAFGAVAVTILVLGAVRLRRKHEGGT